MPFQTPGSHSTALVVLLRERRSPSCQHWMRNSTKLSLQLGCPESPRPRQASPSLFPSLQCTPETRPIFPPSSWPQTSYSSTSKQRSPHLPTSLVLQEENKGFTPYCCRKAKGGNIHPPHTHTISLPDKIPAPFPEGNLRSPLDFSPLFLFSEGRSSKNPPYCDPDFSKGHAELIFPGGL